MGPKKESSNITGKGRRKVMRTTIELKKALIVMFENGVRISHVPTQYDMSSFLIKET